MYFIICKYTIKNEENNTQGYCRQNNNHSEFAVLNWIHALSEKRRDQLVVQFTLQRTQK